MACKVNDIIDHLPAARRRKVEKRAAALLADTLADAPKRKRATVKKKRPTFSKSLAHQLL